jgi:GTP pyrophosphokinase
VVEIIAGKQESPSRDWLILDGYLASPRSRAKLRSWFRHIDAAENEAGEAAQLYRWLGEGEVSAAQLVHAAERVASPTPSVSGTPIATATPAQRRSRKALEVGTTSPGTLRIEGVSDLPLTLAKCCLPAEPAPVAGSVPLGRGVTVHAERCGNLQRMRAEHPERCLSAAWDT